MTPAGLRSLFRYHRQTTGVKLANPHRFRHTFASDMLRGGVSLPALMRLMGHALKQAKKAGKQLGRPKLVFSRDAVHSVSKKKVTDELRERMSAKGKRRLVTMSKAKRYHLAYMAGVQGGRPVVIDHAKVKALRAQGLKHREIAGQMKISLPSVYRILAER